MLALPPFGLPLRGPALGCSLPRPPPFSVGRGVERSIPRLLGPLCEGMAALNRCLVGFLCVASRYVHCEHRRSDAGLSSSAWLATGCFPPRPRCPCKLRSVSSRRIVGNARRSGRTCCVRSRCSYARRGTSGRRCGILLGRPADDCHYVRCRRQHVRHPSFAPG